MILKKGCAIIYKAVKNSFATVLNVGGTGSLEQHEAQNLPRSNVSLHLLLLPFLLTAFGLHKLFTWADTVRSSLI